MNRIVLLEEKVPYWEYSAETRNNHGVRGLVVGGFPRDCTFEEAKDYLLRKKQKIIPETLDLKRAKPLEL